MTGLTQKTAAALAALALGLPGAQPVFAQDATQASTQVSSTPQSGFVLKTNAELVLTNVVARDTKTGEVVRGLKQSDFRVYEDGKEQQIATFDFQSVDMATPLKTQLAASCAVPLTASSQGPSKSP